MPSASRKLPVAARASMPTAGSGTSISSSTATRRSTLLIWDGMDRKEPRSNRS